MITKSDNTIEKKYRSRNIKSKKLICTIHSEIENNLKILLTKCDKDDEKLINKTLELVSIALKMGQNMEDRLKLYRNSIERLGFKRIRG